MVILHVLSPSDLMQSCRVNWMSLFVDDRSTKCNDMGSMNHDLKGTQEEHFINNKTKILECKTTKIWRIIFYSIYTRVDYCSSSRTFRATCPYDLLLISVIPHSPKYLNDYYKISVMKRTFLFHRVSFCKLIVYLGSD